MFFDCSALLLGLVASIVARRNPNEKYSYGWANIHMNILLLFFFIIFPIESNFI